MRGSREGWIKCESLHTIMKTFDEAGTRDDPRVPAHKSSRRIAARGFLQTSDRRYSRQTAAASAAGAAVWLRRRRARRRSTISAPSLGRLLLPYPALIASISEALSSTSSGLS